jgi:hypothetical protein
MTLKDIGKSYKREKLMAGLFWPMLIVFAVLIFLISQVVSFYDPCKESDWIKELSFSGVVDKKVIHKWNRNEHMLWVNTDTERVFVNLSNDSNVAEKGKRLSLLWATVNVGDSIKKNTNEYRVFFKLKDSNWKYIDLGYKDCDYSK